MLRLLLTTVVLLVAAASLAPQTVQASCGDWLAHSLPPAESEAEINGSNETPMQPPPCEGPLCQRSPVTPQPVPPAPTVERERHEVAWLRQTLTIRSALDARWSEEPRFHLSSGHALGIERPPQS